MQNLRSTHKLITAYVITTLFLSGCLTKEESNSAGFIPSPPAANNPPTISGTPASRIDMGNSYSFQPSASDSDGDTLSFAISSKPSWASFDTSTGQLAGTPLLGDIRTFSNIIISVSDGKDRTNLPTFSIEVSNPDNGGGENSAPTISGTASASVAVGANYSFQPTASDADGDPLTFSIQGLPAWASFDTSIGLLSGTPQAGDVGSYNNITISVSDGTDSTNLPMFSIEVINPDDGGGQNTAPTITGAAAASVAVGANYSFQPTASDADGDQLTFSIQGLPAWASFNTSIGLLSGTPQAGDVGSYNNITISVSDNNATASLPPFSIQVTQVALGSVTLTWIAPTTNDDGSALTDLAGFRIYYGTASNNYTQTIQIDSAGQLTHVVDNLSPSTYYFVTTAFTSKGVESAQSNEAIAVVN